MKNLKKLGAGVLAGVSATALSVSSAYAIDIEPIEASLTQAGSNAGTVAGWIALALVVLASAGIVFSMLRKA